MELWINNKMMTNEQITEIAQQSSKHFLFCFEQDDLDVISIIEMLVQCCREHKELAIHVGLIHYCKLYHRDLPEHYKEIAADNGAYDDYCKKLAANLISMTSPKGM